MDMKITQPADKDISDSSIFDEIIGEPDAYNSSVLFRAK